MSKFWKFFAFSAKFAEDNWKLKRFLQNLKIRTIIYKFLEVFDKILEIRIEKVPKTIRRISQVEMRTLNDGRVRSSPLSIMPVIQL